MASPDPVTTPEQDAPPLIGTPDHKASPELIAPSGWQKKIASSKKGSTPSKRDVYFVTPDGEEIKSKKVLDRYLKSHPGGPAASEFDWSTGETPSRRSSRLSSKTRPSLDSPESGSAGKRPKRKVEEEVPKDEEKGELEDLLAEFPLPSDLKTDEVMEDAGKSEEVKVVEELLPVPSLDETEDGKEVESAEVAQMEDTDETVAEVIQMDSEEKKAEVAEIPTEVSADREECPGEKVTREEPNSLESNASFLKEDCSEVKESSEKISNVFQNCPEAPNASRQVDVST